MEKAELEIIGLSYSQTQSGAYALILGEKKGRRRIPIIIGGAEAQSIAIELEDMKPSRPLTHDLFKNFADEFEIIIREVVIYNLVEGVFFAKLVCKKGEIITEIDARTSDAVALAVRFKCPISTYESILEKAGILLDQETEVDELPSDINIETLINPIDDDVSLEELEKQLAEALENEDYEQASKIRDEIKKRK